MADTNRSLESMIQDGALVHKFKEVDGKKKFIEKMADKNLQFFQELIRGKMRIMDLQHVEQTNKWIGDVESIEIMFSYVYSDDFKSGWSHKFYEVLALPVFEPNGQELLKDIKPSEAEVDEYRERCGSTGYPLLKCIEAKHKNAYQALGDHAAPMFDLYPKSSVQKIERIKANPDHSFENLSDACGHPIRQVNAKALIEEMQEKERLLIYNSVGNKTLVAICIANAAVEQGYVCIRKTFPSQQANQSTTEPTYKEVEYFIEHGIEDLPKLDMSDTSYEPCQKALLEQRPYNYDYEAPRTYYRLQEEDAQKKCLVIVQDCDGIYKNQKINNSGKPCDYLGNVIGSQRFPNARVIILTCNPSLCPATNFQCNMPDRYASVSEQSYQH